MDGYFVKGVTESCDIVSGMIRCEDKCGDSKGDTSGFPTQLIEASQVSVPACSGRRAEGGGRPAPGKTEEEN